MNYAVCGTPNRLEYDQGFFVKEKDRPRELQADQAPVQDAGVSAGALPRAVPERSAAGERAAGYIFADGIPKRSSDFSSSL